MLKAGYEQLVKSGAGVSPVVWGQPTADKPRYFVVGDEPCPMDHVMRRPFSGGMADIAMRVEKTMREKDGKDAGAFYYTYLVKCNLPVDALTEEDLMEKWLVALQYEYALSGCKDVICVGGLSRMIAGLIPILPEVLAIPKPKTWLEKAKSLIPHIEFA